MRNHGPINSICAYATFASLSIILLSSVTSCGQKDSRPHGPVSVNRPDTAIITLVEVELKNIVVHHYEPVRLVPMESFRVASDVTSRITSLSVEVGDFVGRDQVIVSMTRQREHSDALTMAADRLRQAARNHEAAGLAIARIEAAYEDKLIARQFYEDALNRYLITMDEKDAAKIALDGLQEAMRPFMLQAPFSGVVTLRLANAGEVVRAGSTILVVAPVNPIRADVEIPHWLAERIREGDAVKVSAFGDTFPGSVMRISPFIDSGSAMRAVVLSVINPGRRMPFGANGTARFDAEARRRVPGIRVTDIHVDSDGDSYVLVINPELSVAERRDVRTGLSAEGWIEIVSGLKQGDFIIEKNAQPLSVGAPVMLEPTEDAALEEIDTAA